MRAFEALKARDYASKPGFYLQHQTQLRLLTIAHKSIPQLEELKSLTGIPSSTHLCGVTEPPVEVAGNSGGLR